MQTIARVLSALIWLVLSSVDASVVLADSTLTTPYYGPSGEVDRLGRIEVLFSRPMVREEEVGRTSSHGPIAFEPKLRGHFEWVTPKAVQFLPESPTPGTEWTCRIPAGTEALDGTPTSIDQNWQIVFRRPHLLESWLDRTEPVHHPWQDPFWLEFDRPVGTAEGALQFVTPYGTIAVHLLPNDPQHPNRIYFRPVTPLRAATTHDLVVEPNLTFLEGTLRLADRQQLRFRTPGPTRFLQGEFNEAGQIVLEPTFSVDVDSLAAFLEVEPAPVHGFVLRNSGSKIIIDGAFLPGESVHIEVRPGFRNVFGLRAERPLSLHLEAPHHAAVLEFGPNEGTLLPGPREYVRLQSENVGDISLRMAWLGPDVYPLARTLRDRLASDGDVWPDTLALDGVTEIPWQSLEPIASSDGADSLHIRDLVLSQLPNRPRAAQGLWIEATAPAKFKSKGGRTRPPLRTDTLLQFGSIGISAFFETQHSLFWITDLITGEPLPRTNVSVWTDSSGVLSRSWQGRSDGSGLAWGPGSGALTGPGRVPRFVLADHDHGATWLALEGVGGHASAQIRAAIVTDREQYGPGDLVRWKAFVRKVSVKGFTEPRLPTLIASLTGDSWQQSVRVHLNAFGAVSGHFRLPERAGNFVLGVSTEAPREDSPPTDSSGPSNSSGAGSQTLLGSRTVVVRTPERTALNLIWTPPTRTPSSDRNLHIEGVVASSGGHGVRSAPVTWNAKVRPFSWSPQDTSAFSHGDAETPRDFSRSAESFHFGLRTDGGGQNEIQGQVTTDNDGRFALEIVRALWQRDGEEYDAQIFLHGVVSGAEVEGSARFDTLTITPGPLRLGLRPKVQRRQALAPLSWEWICIDTSGTPVPEIEVRAALWREEEDGTLTELDERTLLSTDSVQTVTFPHRALGRTFLRLSAEKQNAPVAESWNHRDPPPAQKDQLLTVTRTPSDPGNWPTVGLPQTPPAGAHTLWVLSQEELLASRVLEMSSSSTLTLPRTGSLPGEVNLTAIQIGSDPSAARHGGDARTQLPRYRRAETTFVEPDSAWKAELRLEISPEFAAPGDTVAIRILLRDRLGRPCRGEIALVILESPSAPAEVTGPTPFLESFGGFFDPKRTTVTYVDTRETLQKSGTRAVANSHAPTPRENMLEKARQAPLRDEVTVYWNVGVQTDESGEAWLRFPLPERSARYRIGAFAATVSNGAGGFAADEVLLDATSSTLSEWDLPAFARPEDLFEFAVRVSGIQGEAPLLNLSGAELTRVQSKETPTRDAGPSSWDFSARAQIKSPSVVRFELRAPRQDGGRQFDQVQLPIESEPLEETSITFGTAAPRAEVIVNLDDPEVLGASGLELRLSPTRLSEVADALQKTLASTGPGLEPRLSRLRAHLVARKIAQALPWPVDSMDVAAETNSILWRLTPEGDLTRPLATRDGEREWRYLDAYAFATWGELHRQGLGLKPRPATAFETRMERSLRSLRSAEVIDFDLLAFQLWVMTEYGRTVDPDPDLRWLLARDTSLSQTGRLLLALALDARTRQLEQPLEPAIERQVRAWMDVFLEELGSLQGAKGLLLDRSALPLPFVIGKTADIERTALALQLLARRSPSHPLAGPLLQALLQNRTNGHWGTPHANVLALEAVSSFLGRVEQSQLPSQGRVILGMSRTEGVRFTREDASPKTLHFASAELVRIRRRDPSSSQLEFRFETERMQSLTYQLRFPDRIPAIGAPAHDEGMGVFRRYTDLATGHSQTSFRRGDLTEVEIVIATNEPTSRLWLREPLPAGAVLVAGLTEVTAEPTQVPALDDASTAAELNWILPPLKGGIHVFRYRILWERKGEFGIPGTLVSELDAQDRWGRTVADRVRVE